MKIRKFSVENKDLYLQHDNRASQEDRDGESSTLKFWIAGSDARSMGMASPGSAPGYGKVLEGL